MSLESIINEIDTSMQEELNNIKSEHKLKMDDITRQCDEKINVFRSSYSTKSENDTKNIIRQYEDNIKLQSKKIMDEKKKELITTAIEKLRSSVFSLTKSSEYPEIIKTMISEAKKQLGISINVYCSASEKEKIEAMNIKSINIEIDRSIRSGIIASSSDGKKLLDLQLSTIFDAISYDIELYLYENIK